jgi:hypothetical protein
VGYSKCFGPVAKPVANVFLKTATGEWREFFVDVDSGAAVTVLNKTDCEFLGYTFNSGDYCELEGVGGNKIPCFVHRIDMRIGGEVIQARIAFSSVPIRELYLGRADVFDNFQINLRGKVLDSSFTKEA